MENTVDLIISKRCKFIKKFEISLQALEKIVNEDNHSEFKHVLSKISLIIKEIENISLQLNAGFKENLKPEKNIEILFKEHELILEKSLKHYKEIIDSLELKKNSLYREMIQINKQNKINSAYRA
ncbi:MAG: hypothetical protein ACD_79C00296G0004 [uncultured bacterium]|nr:MAG: hypothetical protein ACD_79C00296G0004 [uncultured bacterium]